LHSIATLPARFAQLRLRDLTLLEHLEELGSLTEVAARLHVTQSAISQALQSVEEAFAAPLVERGRRGQRGVRLTPAGMAALMHLRVARHELEAALGAAGDPTTPELHIGALPLALVQPLPDALARLRRRVPRVHVRLTENTVPNLWRQIEAGELDAIVCRLPAQSERPRLPDGVAHRPVGHESLVLVCARRHPLARRRKPALALLRDYDWVLPPEGSYTRLEIEQLFLRAGLKAPRPAITSMSFHANLRLAAEGSLLAVAPRSAALGVRAVLDLVLFPIAWGREDPAISLVWREANLDNPALVALLDCF
jgi:DNA-binding transcriptional LysR family regulator